MSDRLQFSKEDLRVSSLKALFDAFFEFDLACLSPSILVVLFDKSEGWKGSLITTFRNETAVVRTSHGRSSAGDVPLLARSHDSCVSNHRK